MPQNCVCAKLPDLSHIPMGCAEGMDDAFFENVRTIKDFGSPKRWLYLSQCATCGQNWLVAQEERIFDEYFVARIDQSQSVDIKENNIWPDRFSTYEEVLKFGGSVVSHCQFFETVAWSLVWAAEDLRKERSEITLVEIATLLGIDEHRAAKVVAAIESA